MHVAVLGGGLQGCCIALALVEKGVRVTLFDRNEQLLSRAAVANEGKIHLGYMYGGDPTLRTSRMMMRGAMVFAPFLSRHLGLSIDDFKSSAPAVYLVHRASQRTIEEIAGHLSAVHSLLQEAAGSSAGAYFGLDLRPKPRPWSAKERNASFCADRILAAFDTTEVAVDPVWLAQKLRERIAATPGIGLRLRHEVCSVQEAAGRLVVSSDSSDGRHSDRFDHVVNALWDGRMAVDATFGVRPTRRWMHRLKYGVRIRPPAGTFRPTSVTIVLGPFGEVVSYADGLVYLTWYPECLRARSDEIHPPDWPTEPAEPLRSRIFLGTLGALSEIVFGLRGVSPGALSNVEVKGGAIVAWGDSDIEDPDSELHCRFEIGVTTIGRYHSVDPGKLTMAPYFAGICADRIAAQ